MMGSSGLGMAYAPPRMFARTDASAKEPLPLAPDFFDKVRLTGAAAREYEVVALALVNDAVDRSRKERIYGGADESWRDIGATNGFKRFTKVEGAAQHYRIQGVVCAPMANAMSMLYAERNASMVARRNVFYGNGLDAQNLKTLRERTTADRHQHMALRWEAFNIATATVNFKFDASFLEYTGITLDQDREPVGFKMMHSVEIPECKPLLKSHGLRRMETTEVMILRPSANSSYTEITIEGSFEVADKLTATVLGSYLTQITHQLTKVPAEIQAHRLGAMKVLDKSQWVPAGERKNCSVCLSRFGMMGKKHHCRACGEVICKSCIVTRPHRDEEKFCKKCVVVACSEDELVIPDRHNPLSTPSSSSTSSRHRDPTRDVVRDSYVMQMHRFSDHDPLSASVYNPQVFVPQPGRQQHQYQQPQYNVHHQQAMPHQYRPDKMIGLEELKHMRDDNHSMTASETSYGSTYSSSGVFNENMAPTYDGNDGYYRSEPEDSMIYLDTKSMQRAAASAPASGSDSAMYGMGRGYSARTPVQPPMMQHVESSLAQQRHLLNAMMHQASQAHSQPSRGGYRQYPVSSDF